MDLKITVLLTILLIGGCAGTIDAIDDMAGVGKFSESVSTYDQSTELAVSPSWLYDPQGGHNSVKLGLRWVSSAPEFAVLDMLYTSNSSAGSSSFTLIEGLDIRVNGEVYEYKTSGLTDLDHSSYNTVSKTIYTKSANQVVVPYDLIERMVSAERVTIRLYTSDGYEDADFALERTPEGQRLAKTTFKVLVERVSSLKER